jgi:hypothetical protein
MEEEKTFVPKNTQRVKKNNIALPQLPPQDVEKKSRPFPLRRAL